MKKRKLAFCIIQWKDTKESVNAVISLDGSSNNHTFYTCSDEEDFNNLLNSDKEDFKILSYDRLWI